MDKNKKGISAIVATVLIILITVAAVTIVWAAVIPMITNQLDKGTLCLDAVSQVSLVDAGYTCKQSNGKNISLQIKHGAKDFTLADVQVLVSAGGDTTSLTLLKNNLTKSILPGANEEKVFVLNTSMISGTIDSVSIAPIVTVGNTQEKCEISASKSLTNC